MKKNSEIDQRLVTQFTRVLPCIQKPSSLWVSISAQHHLVAYYRRFEAGLKAGLKVECRF